MKISATNETLRVGDLREFAGPEAEALIEDLRAALRPFHATIEFDLGHLREADCDTVDALLAVYQEFDRDGAARVWRVVNPPPELRQLLELVRLHHLFEIMPPRAARLLPL